MVVSWDLLVQYESDLPNHTNSSKPTISPFSLCFQISRLLPKCYNFSKILGILDILPFPGAAVAFRIGGAHNYPYIFIKSCLTFKFQFLLIACKNPQNWRCTLHQCTTLTLPLISHSLLYSSISMIKRSLIEFTSFLFKTNRLRATNFLFA